MTTCRPRCAVVLAALLLLPTLAPLSADVALATSVVRVQAEDYRAYYDTTPGNLGGACRDDSVDVRIQSDACTVGWWAPGEWLDLQATIPAAGRYVVGARTATGLEENTLTVVAAGHFVELALPVTGDAGTFTVFEGPSIDLPAGALRLKLIADGHHFDIDYLTLRRVSGAAPTPTRTPRPTGQPTAGTPRPTGQPTAGTPRPTSQPPAGTPRPTGQPAPSSNGPSFQIVCAAGPQRRDDPIVSPGRPGASHEHQFFGAAGVDAFSDYAGLAGGDTTCNDDGDSAAYWIPTLYDAGGRRIDPQRVRAYYYRQADDGADLRSFPPNLRVIAGDSRATGPQPASVVSWLCRNRDDGNAGLPLASADPPTCDRDEYLSLSIRFPDCWDGANLDSPDHRRHMAFSRGGVCPAGHPVKVPLLRLSITYDGTSFHGGAFTLGGAPGGPGTLLWYAMHADFWNTWDQDALDEYVAGCLRDGDSVRSAACRR